MSNLDIKNIINDYCNWLKDEITFSEFGEYYEITAPYLDRHNDYLQIYLKQEPNGTITMTDDGCIIEDLLSCGFNLTPKRKKMVEYILNGVNMKLINNSIVATANINNLPQTKHLLFQTMLKIDDMFVLNRNNVENFFFEDVEEYFTGLGAYPTQNFLILGKSGNYHNYEFHFQRT